MTDKDTGTLLITSQVYPPDPTSVGQHIHDVAKEMVQRGYRVIVYTSRRGYEDASVVFPRREIVDGVEIRRIRLSSFGKATIIRRVMGGLSFTLQCAIRGLFVPRLSHMLVSTSPPMCPLAAIVIAAFRSVAVTYWVMDLNPDQMVAMGKLSPTSPFVKILDWLNRMILKRARAVVALDRFMADLLNKKVDTSHKMLVAPPWPHEDHVEPVAHTENPFRKEHGLSDKKVIMYSGNLSPASPVTTILEAARRVEDLEDLVFMFIGGGLGKAEVDQLITNQNPPNIRSLPYQPLETLRFSLSAADVHLVSVGEDIVGICHPCKVYGSMAVSRPILLLGPNQCHVSDILANRDIGWSVNYGEVDKAESVLREIHATSSDQLHTMGSAARRTVDEQFTKEHLCGQFCNVLEHGISSATIERTFD